MSPRVPSQIKDRFWLVAIDENYSFRKPKTERDSGKWLIFDTPTRIDQMWSIIRKAQKNGVLGPSSKVATAKPNPNARDNSVRVICVYTEDFNDKEDVQRVEKIIRDLGIKNRLVYKLDRDVGRYEHQGEKDLIKLVSEVAD